MNQSLPTDKLDVSEVDAHVADRKRTLVNRVVLGLLVVGVLLVFVPMIKMFMTPLLLAGTFTVLFYPLYAMLLKLLRGNRTLAALSCCVLLVLGFVVPIYFLGYLVTHQFITLYQSVEPVIQSIVQGDDNGVLSRFKESPFYSLLTRFHFNWQNSAFEAFKSIGAFMGQMANKTSLGALQIVLGLFLTLFIMFYLFMDGEQIAKKIRQVIPLRPAYQDMIIMRFQLVSRATVKGTLVIATIQGTLGAIILLIFGIKTWLLWGVVMIVLGFIPMGGAWLILVPVGIIQVLIGHVWQGAIILGLSFGVVSSIDNVLRPRLVGQNARMHDLLIFFSTIGGLAMFGPVGVITGPVVMAFFVSIIEICMLELKGQDLAHEEAGIAKVDK